VYPKGATRFFFADMRIDATIEFQTDGQGQTTCALLLQNGARITMPRIDAAGAQQIKATRLARLQSQTPAAGSEAAIRHLVDGILIGRPEFNKLSPQIAGQIAKDLPVLQLTLAPLGSLKSLAFRSIDPSGWDVYDGTHAHGSSEWRIEVDNEGIITAIMFPVVATN
jgi:hypothetical protein